MVEKFNCAPAELVEIIVEYYVELEDMIMHGVQIIELGTVS
jgi:hypothetical protein